MAGRDSNDKAKNKVAADKAELSKYFVVIKYDLPKNGSLPDSYLISNSQTKINADTKISFDYN